MSDLPFTAVDYDSLVEGLRLRKAELGLSNNEIDRLAGLTAGHTDKVLGPSQSKGMGKMVLDLLLEVLAVNIIIVPDLERAIRMQGRYDARIKNKVRTKRRPSRALIEAARPLIEKEFYKEFANNGNAARNSMLAGEHRSELASRAARTRWGLPTPPTPASTNSQTSISSCSSAEVRE